MPLGEPVSVAKSDELYRVLDVEDVVVDVEGVVVDVEDVVADVVDSGH